MRRLLVAGLLVVVAACVAQAQPPGAAGSRSSHQSDSDAEAREDAHQPRHGGHFGDADDLYHYEALLQPGPRLVIYVNDEHHRPLDVRVLQGRWTLDPDGGSPVTGVLSPSEDGAYFFAALPPRPGELAHVKIAVLKGDVWAEMEFFLPVPKLIGLGSGQGTEG